MAAHHESNPMAQTRIHIFNSVTDGNEGEFRLCFQRCRYFFADGKKEDGFRFIWMRDDGSLQAARGQARIPSVAHAHKLIKLAKDAGWGHYMVGENGLFVPERIPNDDPSYYEGVLANGDKLGSANFVSVQFGVKGEKGMANYQIAYGNGEVETFYGLGGHLPHEAERFKQDNLTRPYSRDEVVALLNEAKSKKAA
jgi:hypothetical protein